jgi:hypothetical protein
MAGHTLGHHALALARSGKTSLAEAAKVSNQGDD